MKSTQNSCPRNYHEKVNLLSIEIFGGPKAKLRCDLSASICQPLRFTWELFQGQHEWMTFGQNITFGWSPNIRYRLLNESHGFDLQREWCGRRYTGCGLHRSLGSGDFGHKVSVLVHSSQVNIYYISWSFNHEIFAPNRVQEQSQETRYSFRHCRM